MCVPSGDTTTVLWAYLFYAIALFVLAIKSGYDSPWHAFIPIMNLWMLTEMAGLPLWWVLLLLVPYLDIAVAGWVFMNIFDRNGQPKFMGLLMLLPFVNVIAAFAAGPPRR